MIDYGDAIKLLAALIGIFLLAIIIIFTLFVHPQKKNDDPNSSSKPDPDSSQDQKKL